METIESGKSSVNVIPRNNNVLIKMCFKTSILAVVSGKYEGSNTEPATFEVAGIGPSVRDLTIGDNIVMKLEQYESVPVKGNENSIINLKKHYDTLPKHEVSKLGMNKVDVVEYGMFPEFQIRAIVK